MNQIVIVDDAPLNIRIYEQVVKSLPDVAVKGFTASSEALGWCRYNSVDLLIVDYHMPPPNGLETATAFRALPDAADVPTVMITGETDRDLRLRALDVGVDEFFTKPVDPAEVLVRTRNLLALRARNREAVDRQASLTEEVRRATAEISSREQETIVRLTRAAEFRDNETGNHIIRMGHYASTVAAALGRKAAECELILRAAPMHDIGKVSIPDTILLKNGKLTPDEWEIMKSHVVAGYEILRGSKSTLIRQGAEIALSHHEKFDGTGYPYGLRGHDIPLSGRVCAIADVFDALLSNRPYKTAWSIDRALAHILEQSGKHFDPRVVDAFNEALPEIDVIRHRYSDAQEAA